MFRYCFLIFLASAPASAAPVISEFLASNQSGIRDEGGNRPDWIEIRNDAPEPVNLAGWALTDDAAVPREWVFPDSEMEPGAHLLVFASVKARAVAGAPLHTGFNLSAAGEYLALVNPDGAVATEFAPAFPPQFPDTSYGKSTNTTEVRLVDATTPVRAFVPQDTSLIPQWRTD